MLHEGFSPHSSPETAPAPLSPEQRRALADYVTTLSRVNSAGPESVGLNRLRTLAQLRQELGDDTIRAHVTAYEVNGGIFFPGTEPRR